MIRILTSVEITKDNPEYLRFKYNDNSYQEYLITNDAPEACTTHMGDLDNTCIGALDKGERKICKDDCVYYLIENGQQIRDRRNEKISNRCDNFEYCIFLINTNFHGETFSDATFYGATTFLEKRVAIKSTLPLNIVSTELTSPLNSVPPKATFLLNFARLKLTSSLNFAVAKLAYLINLALLKLTPFFTC
jgi:hypothetical protein